MSAHLGSHDSVLLTIVCPLLQAKVQVTLSRIWSVVLRRDARVYYVNVPSPCGRMASIRALERHWLQSRDCTLPELLCNLL